MSTQKKALIPVTLIPGDGIGPEIMESAIEVLAALGAPFEWDKQFAGLAGFEAKGDPLPEETLASIRRTRLALKGPLSTPLAKGYRSATVRMREEFDLFANVRPAKTIVPGRYEDIDIVLIRENLEGFYVAHEHYIRIGDDPRAAAMSGGVNTRAECARITRYAFEYAIKHNRKKITIVHKANVLKVLSGLFLEEARNVAKEYEGRVQVVLNPYQFDMLLCTNLFGDILSDLIAGLVGGLGLAPGANMGEDVAMFEAIHGSAPDIAGKGIANPISLLLSSGLMLDHVGESALADRLRQAIELTLTVDNVKTPDLRGKATTRELTRAVIARLG